MSEYKSKLSVSSMSEYRYLLFDGDRVFVDVCCHPSITGSAREDIEKLARPLPLGPYTYPFSYLLYRDSFFIKAALVQDFFWVLAVPER